MLEETGTEEWLTLREIAVETGQAYDSLKRRAQQRGIGRLGSQARLILRGDIGRLLEYRPVPGDHSDKYQAERYEASMQRQRAMQEAAAKWHDVLRAIAPEVHVLTGVSFETLMAPGREPYIVYARMLVTGVMRRYGATVADIGRALQRTHSTIVNLLLRMGIASESAHSNHALPEAIRMEISDTVDILIARLAPLIEFSPLTNALQVPLSSLGTLIHSRLPEPEASSVVAYINGLLLARTNRNNGPAIANGIWYVASRPDVRHVVITALARTGQSLYEPHLKYHAARYGYPWQDAPAQQRAV